MRRYLVLGWILLIGFVPFGILPSTAFATSYSLTASGPWTSDDGLLSGTWQAHFDVAGFDLSGTLNIVGLADVGEGNIAGSWDLQHLGFGVMFLNQEVATFTGGLQGDHLAGTFETGQIVGHWSGALSSLKLTTQPIVPIIDATIPTLLLSHISGNLGDLVSLGATLYTLGAPIVSVENIINFDSLSTPILALANGAPACTVNPAINKADTLFQFLPLGCKGSACTQVRALVQSFTNVDAIADGTRLYTCRVQILKQAATGIYQLVADALSAIDADAFE